MTNSEILMRMPPVPRALARLHLDTHEWLAAAGISRITLDRVDRATQRASLAIELAVDGSKKAANLRRARDSMIIYLSHMRFLCLQGHLSLELFDEAERRVEQVREAFRELEHLDLVKWAGHELPPLRAPESAEAPSSGNGADVQLTAGVPPPAEVKDSPAGDCSRPDLPAADGASGDGTSTEEAGDDDAADPSPSAARSRVEDE